ncbi:MAG: ABC transporter ATP-binding protein [Bdellovibrionota bacterium]
MIKIIDLYKSYKTGVVESVLRGVNINIAQGESVALLGPSGSGKSTLLNCLGLLDDVDKGQIFFDDVEVTKLNEKEKAKVRLSTLGFVFQFHHLIPELSAIENVLLPASLLGERPVDKAEYLLKSVGLEGKWEKSPAQLSGGEQQRVAIARALINGPKILLTDEATGNLDRERSLEILELLLDFNREQKMTLISVTHDSTLATRYETTYSLTNGILK